jgi:hypothetical protein
MGWMTRNDCRVRYRGVTKTIIGCITEPPRSTSAD